MYEYKIKEIVKIVDGDTIDILIDLGFGLTKKERVRLAGIDTPESRTTNLEEKAMGLEAKEVLTKMLSGGKLAIKRQYDSINSKEKDLTGRINNETILLKIVK